MPRSRGRIQICRKCVAGRFVVELAVHHAGAGAHALHVAGADDAGELPPAPLPMLSRCASAPSST
jgi:hypothetical protein